MSSNEQRRKEIVDRVIDRNRRMLAAPHDPGRCALCDLAAQAGAVEAFHMASGVVGTSVISKPVHLCAPCRKSLNDDDAALRGLLPDDRGLT